MARALAPWPASVRAQPKTLGQEGSFRRVQSAGQLRRQIVDAMIPGTRTAATEKGELALLVTVDPSLLDRLTPVFQAIGSRSVNPAPWRDHPQGLLAMAVSRKYGDWSPPEFPSRVERSQVITHPGPDSVADTLAVPAR